MFTTVVVRVQLPAAVTREQAFAAIEQSIPVYQAVPGLLIKAFTLSEKHEIGGSYLFDSRAAAEAHFDAAWHERVKKTYGVTAEVLYFDTPSVIDNRSKTVLRP